MSISRLFSWLTILTIVALAPNAYGQYYQPFIEPNEFNPDFQFFAPAEIDDFGGQLQPNTGWFFTYDQLYLNVSRPQAEIDNEQGDFSWGNRIDFGYMTEEDHGWLFSLTHMAGPNVSDVVGTERLNRLNTDDPPILPRPDQNNQFTLARDYLVTDSINVATMSSFEANKTFRLDPLHNGAIVEGIVGLRYFNLRDFYLRQTYSSLPAGLPPTEDLVSDSVLTENQMFGGQIGFRILKKRKRWNLSADVKAFALENFQSIGSSSTLDRTTYDTALNDVVRNETTRTRTAADNNEFVFGTEVRGEAAYDLTRDLALRVGVEYIQFVKGIGRGPSTGNNSRNNSQNMSMVGFTFGITLNR